MEVVRRAGALDVEVALVALRASASAALNSGWSTPGIGLLSIGAR